MPVVHASGRCNFSLPLLDGEPLSVSAGGAVHLTRILDPDRDLYLGDHRLDGRPVLPAAVAMELIAEVAHRGWPGLEISELRSFRVLNGVVLDKATRSIRILARAETQPSAERMELALDVSIVDPETNRPFYKASVLLSDRLPEPPPVRLAPLRDPRPFPLSVQESYARWLFHGPLMQGIVRVAGIGEEGISGILRSSRPSACMKEPGGGDWLIDPVVVDSAFQLGILHSRSRYDMTPLPSRFRRFRRFAPLSGRTIGCEFRSRAVAGGQILEIQIDFVDENGRLLGCVEDMELSCSRELNRLAGNGAGGGPR